MRLYGNPVQQTEVIRKKGAKKLKKLMLSIIDLDTQKCLECYSWHAFDEDIPNYVGKISFWEVTGYIKNDNKYLVSFKKEAE